MNKEFVNDFFNIRDETLKDIQDNSYNWNRFIIYWSKILDDYSIDNVLNLYSYNSSGRVLFLTYILIILVVEFLRPLMIGIVRKLVEE